MSKSLLSLLPAGLAVDQVVVAHDRVVVAVRARAAFIAVTGIVTRTESTRKKSEVPTPDYSCAGPCSWQADRPILWKIGGALGRGEAVLLEQLAHELESCRFVASALNEHLQDLAFIINSPLQMRRPAADAHGYFVQVLARAGLGPQPP